MRSFAESERSVRNKARVAERAWWPGGEFESKAESRRIGSRAESSRETRWVGHNSRVGLDRVASDRVRWVGSGRPRSDRVRQSQYVADPAFILHLDVIK